MAETSFASPTGWTIEVCRRHPTSSRCCERFGGTRRSGGSWPAGTSSSARIRRRHGGSKSQRAAVALSGASGVKTGSTAGAGYCLVATARRAGRELAAVVLGGRDEVFSEAAALLNHGFAAYDVRTLVSEGAPLGSVRMRGGTVPVVAGEGAGGARARAGQRGDRAARHRIGVGCVPSRERFRSGNAPRDLRWNRSRAGARPGGGSSSPEEPRGSWWGRALGALSSAVGSVIGDLMD